MYTVLTPLELKYEGVLLSGYLQTCQCFLYCKIIITHNDMQVRRTTVGSQIVKLQRGIVWLYWFHVLFTYKATFLSHAVVKNHFFSQIVNV